MSIRHTRAQTSIPPSLEAQVQRIAGTGAVRPSRAAVLRAALERGLPLVCAEDIRPEAGDIPPPTGSGTRLTAEAS